MACLRSSPLEVASRRDHKAAQVELVYPPDRQVDRLLEVREQGSWVQRAAKARLAQLPAAILHSSVAPDTLSLQAGTFQAQRMALEAFQE